MDLDNEIALVTGSAHRVVKQIALHLAGEGCQIIINYNQSEDQALETLHEVKDRGVNTIALQANLSRHDEITHLFEGHLLLPAVVIFHCPDSNFSLFRLPM